MEGSSVTRFKEILKVFTNYGLGYLLGKKEEKEKKSPSNLRKAFEELGPTFIKYRSNIKHKTRTYTGGIYNRAI